MSLSKNSFSSFEDINLIKNDQKFSNKFKSIPIVESTWYWLCTKYIKVKEINFVTNATLSLAENTVKTTSVLATPLLKKFRVQVEAFDNIACLQLDRLETFLPLIKSNTESLVYQSMELLSTWKTPSALDNLNLIYNKSYQYSPFDLKAKSIKLVSKVLDHGENFIGENLVGCELKKSDSESNNQLIKNYLNFKQDNSEMSVVTRGRNLSLIFCECVKQKIIRLLSSSIEQIKIILLNSCKIVEIYDTIKQKASLKLQDQFNVKFN
jgi:hypothetical protein